MYLSLAPLQQQQENSARILTPVPGEVLQGLIAVEGDAHGPEFAAYELAFSAQGDATDTWFVLARSNTPATAALLAEWDTTALTDGEYTLRLVMQLTNGETSTHFVENLRVRNYSPVETNTPGPTATLEPGQMPTATTTSLPPTVTPLPPNPALIPPARYQAAVTLGALSAPGLLAALAIYSYRRRRNR